MTVVLVVDDSPVDRHLVGSLLAEEGSLQVEFASHGGEALERVKASPPDIVLSDLQMPGLDGLGLIEALKQSHPQIPIVVMTSKGSEEFAVKALRTGAASYLPKSRLAAELLPTIDEVLSVARADRHVGRLSE